MQVLLVGGTILYSLKGINMAYNQNIPQPADQLKNSQPQILGNFQEINTALNVNHVGFNVADEGKHKFLQMPRQGGSPTTAGTDLGLFALIGANSGVSELNFRRQADGEVIPFTEGLLANPGWTILPSGLLVKWGSGVLPASGGSVTNLAWTVPIQQAGNIRDFTAPPFMVMLTASKPGAGRIFANYYWNPATTTNLLIGGTSESIQSAFGASPIPSYTINYIAIGI